MNLGVCNRIVLLHKHPIPKGIWKIRFFTNEC